MLLLTGAETTVKLFVTLQLVLAVSNRASPALLASMSRRAAQLLRICTRALACGEVDLIVEIATPCAIVEGYDDLLTVDIGGNEWRRIRFCTQA